MLAGSDDRMRAGYAESLASRELDSSRNQSSEPRRAVLCGGRAENKWAQTFGRGCRERGRPVACEWNRKHQPRPDCRASRANRSKLGALARLDRAHKAAARFGLSVRSG